MSKYTVYVKEFDRDKDGCIVDGRVSFEDCFDALEDALVCYNQILEDGENEDFQIWRMVDSVEALEDGSYCYAWAYAGSRGSSIQEATQRIGISGDE